MKTFVRVKRVFFLLSFALFFQACSRNVRNTPSSYGLKSSFEFYLFADVKGEKYQSKGEALFFENGSLIVNLKDPLLQQELVTVYVNSKGEISIENHYQKETLIFRDKRLAEILVEMWPAWLEHSVHNINVSSLEDRYKTLRFSLTVLKNFSDGKVRRFELKSEKRSLVIDILRYNKGNVVKAFRSKADYKQVYLNRPSLSYLLEVFYGS